MRGEWGGGGGGYLLFCFPFRFYFSLVLLLFILFSFSIPLAHPSKYIAHFIPQKRQYEQCFITTHKPATVLEIKPATVLEIKPQLFDHTLITGHTF